MHPTFSGGPILSLSLALTQRQSQDDTTLHDLALGGPVPVAKSQVELDGPFGGLILNLRALVLGLNIGTDTAEADWDDDSVEEQCDDGVMFVPAQGDGEGGTGPAKEPGITLQEWETLTAELFMRYSPLEEHTDALTSFAACLQVRPRCQPDAEHIRRARTTLDQSGLQVENRSSGGAAPTNR
jgi:hypothetical protein